MGLLTVVGRIVLVVINIIFILLSLAFVMAGFILRFGQGWLRHRVDDVLDEIVSEVQNAYGNANFNMDNFEFGSLANTLGYIMIGTGAVLLVIALLGCCGACCLFKTLLLVYSIILIVLLVVQIVLVILVFAAPDSIKDRIKDSLLDTMSDYNGIQGTSVSAMCWNVMQQQYKCCGAVDYKDFEKKGSSYMRSNANDNAAISGTIGNVRSPVACCKTLPSTAADRAKCAGNGAVPSDTDSNLNEGCVKKVWKRTVEDNTVYYGLAIGFCFAFQILLIFFSCLIYQEKSSKVGLA